MLSIIRRPPSGAPGCEGQVINIVVGSLCVYSLQWSLSSLSGSNVLRLEGTGNNKITTAGPCSQPLWPPLGSPRQPFGIPGTRLAAQASSHRLRKQPRGPPDPHFGALAIMPCMFSLFVLASFPTISDHFWDHAGSTDETRRDRKRERARSFPLKQKTYDRALWQGREKRTKHNVVVTS